MLVYYFKMNQKTLTNPDMFMNYYKMLVGKDIPVMETVMPEALKVFGQHKELIIYDIVRAIQLRYCVVDVPDDVMKTIIDAVKDDALINAELEIPFVKLYESAFPDEYTAMKAAFDYNSGGDIAKLKRVLGTFKTNAVYYFATYYAYAYIRQHGLKGKEFTEAALEVITESKDIDWKGDTLMNLLGCYYEMKYYKHAKDVLALMNDKYGLGSLALQFAVRLTSINNHDDSLLSSKIVVEKVNNYLVEELDEYLLDEILSNLMNKTSLKPFEINFVEEWFKNYLTLKQNELSKNIVSKFILCYAVANKKITYYQWNLIE